MKKFLLSAALAGSTLLAFATPANAVLLVNGSTNLVPTDFTALLGTQGTLLASQTVSGQAFTFATSVTEAVYRNTFGNLDFYYQVTRTGAGSTGASQEIDGFTAAAFDSFTVDGYSLTSATGPFAAANNPNLANGLPSPLTTTYGRSLNGNVLQVALGLNGLTGNENTETFVFRTNATQFTTGTFGVIDGSTFSGFGYQPLSAVPEPATWAMMLGGFGLLGAAMRRTRRVKAVMA